MVIKDRQKRVLPVKPEVQAEIDEIKRTGVGDYRVLDQYGNVLPPEPSPSLEEALRKRGYLKEE